MGHIRSLKPTPDIGQVQGLDVVALQVKRAVVKVVQPLDKLDHGGLAAPGLPDQRNFFPSLHRQVESIEHLEYWLIFL